MAIDGTKSHPVSAITTRAVSPAATPDGRVVFAAIGASVESSRIVSVKIDGTDEREESDSARAYWGPVVGAGGKIFCHGSGPEPVKQFSNGSLVVHGAPTETIFANRRVALYPVRNGGVLPHPRRNELLLVEEDDAKKEVRLLAVDLSGQHSREIMKVPPSHGAIMDLKYSRDGNWITFMTGTFFGDAKSSADIWVARSDGSELTNITANVPGNDGLPDFSGDARRIVFRSYRTGNPNIFLMNSDGAGVRQLTDHLGRDTFPAFCPTRNEIAFVSDRDGELDQTGLYRSMDIYTLQLGPGGAPGTFRRMTDDPGHDSHVQYSPDGEWLVFSSERGGQGDEWPLIPSSPQSYGEIYALRLKDKLLVRLTHNKWEEGPSTWVGPAE